MISVHTEAQQTPRDEIQVVLRIFSKSTLKIININFQEFLDARWLSSVEAAHEIMAYPINSMFPNVQRLQIHLPGGEMCAFKATNGESFILDLFY